MSNLRYWSSLVILFHVAFDINTVQYISRLFLIFYCVKFVCFNISENISISGIYVVYLLYFKQSMHFPLSEFSLKNNCNYE